MDKLDKNLIKLEKRFEDTRPRPLDWLLAILGWVAIIVAVYLVRSLI